MGLFEDGRALRYSNERNGIFLQDMEGGDGQSKRYRFFQYTPERKG